MKFILTLLLLCSLQGMAQIRWHSPANDSVVQGQGWPAELKGRYGRLPERAQTQVRTPVWKLSRNSAGISVHFFSDAPEITVRYQVEGNHAMPHMPATGVSGVDLYAIDKNGQELWCAGNYNFGDTIRYRFKDLFYGQNKGYEYRLYLPLYNTVKWLEIGVPDTSAFTYIPLRPEKPIVVYGTSIAQGACASRPGMAWPNILQRRLDCPLINLGFSGNGRLEKEVLNFINELDACLFVIDCMPNMPNDPEEKTEQLLYEAVLQIRENHPRTPILITEHDGYAHQYTNRYRTEMYAKTNRAARKAFNRLEAEQVPTLYYLSYAEIAMPRDAMVDGTHATDYGMMAYADAYEKKIRNILHMPIGKVRTTQAVSQQRDSYNWKQRHADVLRLNRETPPRAVIIGNSITHYWGGLPQADIRRAQQVWDKYLTPAGFHNLGFGWDKIENMLWRIYHGELDGYRAEWIVLLAGTNNLQSDTDTDILCGIDSLISAIRTRQSDAALKVLGILPRRGMEERISTLNKQIKELAIRRKVTFADPGTRMLKNGKIDESLFRDGLHPNEKGYARIVKDIIK